MCADVQEITWRAANFYTDMLLQIGCTSVCQQRAWERVTLQRGCIRQQANVPPLPKSPVALKLVVGDDATSLRARSTAISITRAYICNVHSRRRLH